MFERRQHLLALTKSLLMITVVLLLDSVSCDIKRHTSVLLWGFYCWLLSSSETLQIGPALCNVFWPTMLAVQHLYSERYAVWLLSVASQHWMVGFAKAQTGPAASWPGQKRLQTVTACCWEVAVAIVCWWPHSVQREAQRCSWGDRAAIRPARTPTRKILFPGAAPCRRPCDAAMMDIGWLESLQARCHQ